MNTPLPQFQSQLKISDVLSKADWFVFFFVILLTTLAVFYGEWKKKSIKGEKESFLDMLILGRQLTLPMFVATLVATWYGGIIGVTQIAFERGIYNFVTQGVFWYITYLIFAFFIVRKVRSFNAITLPELVGQMYGPKSAKISAFFNFFNILPVAYVISTGLFLQTLFGISFPLACGLGITMVVAYNLLGGFRSVVYSDLVQFSSMCIGVLVVFIYSISTFGGWSFLTQNLPASHFNWHGDQSLLSTFVWGLIALVTLVDPSFYQRCFAARSEKVAVWGIILSTVVWILFDVCTTAGGMYARAVIPQAVPAESYLVYSVQVLPSGLRGVMLAGVFSTIVSTVDAFLFIAGTTLSYDFMPKHLRGKVWVNQAGTIIVGIVAFFLAIFFQGDIPKVWKTLGSYAAACLLFPILFGYIFPRRLKDNQFVMSCLVGAISVTYWKFAKHNEFWGQFDELYIGVLATSLILFTFLALNSRPKKSV